MVFGLLIGVIIIIISLFSIEKHLRRNTAQNEVIIEMLKKLNHKNK